MGNPDVGLPKVDRLIKDRNYNEAIKELAIYMDGNPDDFDGVQRRIQKIMTMRRDYNDKAFELLLVLANEPTNDKKKLDMITYMESLEKNPNKSTQSFIAETKEAAQFTYYRARFDEIMATGGALIEQGKYAEAARAFTEGFTFYKTEFDETSDPALVAKINENLLGIDSSIAALAAAEPTLSAALAAYEAAVAADDPALAETTGTALSAELGAFIAKRNALADRGWFLEDSFERAKAAKGDVTENSFLPFAWRFAVGRKTAERFEGVLGAFDGETDAVMRRVESVTEGASRAAWTQAYGFMDADDMASAYQRLAVAGRYATVGAAIAKTCTAIAKRPDTFGIRDYPALGFRFKDILDYTNRAASGGKLFGEYRAFVSSSTPVTEEVDSAEHVRKAQSSTMRKYFALTDGLSAFIKSAQGLSSGTPAPGNEAYASDLAAWNARFSGDASAVRLESYRKNASFQDRSVALMASGWKTDYASALTLLDGIPRKEDGLTLYYPAESIVSFNKIRTGITADRKSIAQALALLERAPADVLADESFANSLAAMRAALTGMDATFTDSGASIARANSRVLQANIARQESDLRYNQALTALRQMDFRGARDNLQRSREKINASLSFQESASLRASSDQKLDSLGSEITRIENEAVVREVRSLISSGRNFYYSGDFDQAEQIFLQAKSRWSVTNSVPNTEVSTWLDIINTALSMKTGRTIPVTAPLYPQMSQLLSSANQMYLEGKTLMASGRRDAALARLADARAQLQKLQLVYPLNQDAGQLTLLINQLIDPPAFRQFVDSRIEYIRANYKTERQTSYSDLLDLYQLNSSYPGIKKLLDEVEYYLGVRIPPPDPKAIARSAELTKAAQKIYDSNTRSQFEVALEQLDEAIKLNSDNQRAIALKDRVQTALGGKNTAVLSSADESLYQRAVQELQKANKITASALVEQLWQNQKNRNSTKIQELKKRIESQL